MTSPSRLYNQDFLLLTELPSMVTVLETNYEMEHSPSYTGNIHDVSSIVDFLYCMPLGNALQINFDWRKLPVISINYSI